MKYIIILFLLFLTEPVFSQAGKPASPAGRYAGTKKNLVGKVYTDSHTIPSLKGWTYMQGSVLNLLSDPEMITVDVFKKGTSFIVFFSIKEDTASEEFMIADVMEIKAVTKGWTIKTSLCRQQQIGNSWIVACVNETSTEYLKIIKKAWRFNPDKRRIELISVKGIDCLNEGFDQY